MCVSWNDAKAFCQWLSLRAGKPYGLPTEAQWEYACRAGSDGIWPWGDREEDALGKANVAGEDERWNDPFKGVKDSYKKSTAPVSTFAANAFGLRDMIGNVVEWCSDWHTAEYYAESPPADPTGPTEGRFRLSRGGSWGTGPQYSRTAYRARAAAAYACACHGFRVCRVPRTP